MKNSQCLYVHEDPNARQTIYVGISMNPNGISVNSGTHRGNPYKAKLIRKLLNKKKLKPGMKIDWFFSRNVSCLKPGYLKRFSP